MSDLFSSGFFFPGAGGQGVSKELRQRIALAMLAQKRKAPSTFGEGLSAIGDSLGEMGTMRRLMAEEGAAFAGGNKQADELLGVTPPGAGVLPPEQPPMTAAPPQDQTPVPPTVQEGGPPVPPRPMFRPNAPVRATAMPPLPPAAPAVPTPPDQQQSYEPGAPVRMSTDAQLADFRAQNPLPPGLPPVPGAPPAPGVPQQPGGARPTVADFGQKLALAPTDPNASPLDNMPWPHGNVGAPPQPGTPPVMAQGGDDPRRAIALSMLRQGQTGQPQRSDFAPAAPPPAAPPPTAPPPAQSIAQAPPAAPIQKMPPPAPPQPPQDGPQPGYVSQPLKPVIAPMPEQMSPQEAKLRDAIARDPEGPSGQLTRRLAPVLSTLEANRAAINQRNIEKYKVDIAAEAARIQKIEDQKTGAAKDIADVASTQARTRKEGVIEEPDNKMILGPDGIARPIQIDSGPGSVREPPLPKNEAQLKALKHHEQMVDAEKIIGDGKALRGINSATGARVPIAGAWLQSDDYRREHAAAARWVVNKLRPESGAQFSEGEIDREVKAYFPQPADDAKTIADKNAARRLANEGMLESSGREGKKYMEWKNARAAEADAAKQTEINEAKQWIQNNPNDPRAAKIRQRLGL